MNHQTKPMQHPMLGIAFHMMRVVMSVKRYFRNIDEEIGLSGLKSGDVVLDFGCGPGFNTIPAAQKVGSQGKVYALDVHPKAIAIIEREKRKHGLHNIETLVSDCGIPLEDQTVDIVYLHNTLPLITHKKEVLREIRRVLKVHGRLSYMSRKGSRMARDATMNDQDVREYLETELHFQLVQENKGQFIFKRKQ
jgi:ubiquinone/menaquinone biosynthesis C-methylase UbiE